MKKIFSIVICMIFIFALSACGTTVEKRGDTMSLEEIFESIQANVQNLPEVAFSEITEENYRYYLFIDPVKDGQALACDAIINAVPHSAVLLRVPEGKNAESVAEEIRTNADTNKWICVEAEAMDVSVHNRTVLLVISEEETVHEMINNFDELWE